MQEDMSEKIEIIKSLHRNSIKKGGGSLVWA